MMVGPLSRAGIVRDKPSAIAMAVTKWWDDLPSKKGEAVMQLANMILEVMTHFAGSWVFASPKEENIFVHVLSLFYCHASFHADQ